MMAGRQEALTLNLKGGGKGQTPIAKRKKNISGQGCNKHRSVYSKGRKQRRLKGSWHHVPTNQFTVLFLLSLCYFYSKSALFLARRYLLQTRLRVRVSIIYRGNLEEAPYSATLLALTVHKRESVYVCVYLESWLMIVKHPAKNTILRFCL